MSPYLLFRNREFSSFKSRRPEMSRREIYKLYKSDFYVSVVCSSTIATILIFSANTSIFVIKRYTFLIQLTLVVASQPDTVDASSPAVGDQFPFTGLFVSIRSVAYL